MPPASHLTSPLRRACHPSAASSPPQAALALDPPATLMGLAVYRYNDVPVQLYTSAGYAVDGAWQDQRWNNAAERGSVGVARRQLMLKQLPGAPRPLEVVPRRPLQAERAASQ